MRFLPCISAPVCIQSFVYVCVYLYMCVYVQVFYAKAASAK